MKDYLGLTVLYRIVRMTQAALRTVAQPNKHVRQKKSDGDLGMAFLKLPSIGSFKSVREEYD